MIYQIVRWTILIGAFLGIWALPDYFPLFYSIILLVFILDVPRAIKRKEITWGRAVCLLLLLIFYNLYMHFRA